MWYKKRMALLQALQEEVIPVLGRAQGWNGQGEAVHEVVGLDADSDTRAAAGTGLPAESR